MTHIFLSLLCLLALLYGTLIGLYTFWWNKMKIFEPEALPVSALRKEKDPGIQLSIIIPARDEQAHIENCLKSILAGDYPRDLYEIIVIDDFSTDKTVEKIQAMQSRFKNIRLLSLEEELGNRPINSYKKMAIQLAIDRASGEWIVATDADCIAPAAWLSNYAQYIAVTGKRFIAAPVCFFDVGGFLGKFQCLDFLSLQGITAASVGAGFLSMCNGANLCYQKSAFYAVGGFKGIDNLASGDDMLLMHKIQKQFPDSVGYLFSPQSTIRTWPMGTWKDFINQRVRWASKAGSYQDAKIKLVLLLVYLWNLGLLILLLTGIFNPALWLWWLGLLLFKFGIEWAFMRKVAFFFGQGHLLRSFFYMQPFHMLYTVIAGWLGLFGSYQWKGRKVK